MSQHFQDELLAFLSDLCEQDSNTSWTDMWCSIVHAKKRSNGLAHGPQYLYPEEWDKLRELEIAAHGYFQDCSTEESEPNTWGIPNVRFINRRTCRHCKLEKDEHVNGRCLFDTTKFEPQRGVREITDELSRTKR